VPFADSHGVRIWWEECGSGDPLLLIMGLGATHDWWHRTVPVVSRRFRTILFDNRGAGRSDLPPGPYTMAQMAADAAAVLDAARAPGAHIFGMSMGGMIAQEFALQYPERVRRLVLGCTACGGPLAVRADPEATSLLMNHSQLTVDEAIAQCVPIVYDASTPRERIEEDIAIRRRTYPDPAAYAAQLQAIRSWQSYDRLPRIAAPTLVIHGESDRLVPPANGRLVAGRIPGAHLVILPRASHTFFTDQPDLAHQALMGFLTATG
jgi:3-oxoadipate enol-lactonase